LGVKEKRQSHRAALRVGVAAGSWMMISIRTILTKKMRRVDQCHQKVKVKENDRHAANVVG
jgi:hypothetical protein